jgi:hypothetical protein
MPLDPVDAPNASTTPLSAAEIKVVSKRDRLERVFAYLQVAPTCRSGLEAYRQLCDVLNLVEDEALGPDSWVPPKSFVGQPLSDRMYPTYPESMLSVSEFPGVTALWHAREVVFVSRYGALEVRERDGRGVDAYVYAPRDKSLLFDKVDAYGDGVWNGKNRI